jgi:hypothetical protein
MCGLCAHTRSRPLPRAASNAPPPPSPIPRRHPPKASPYAPPNAANFETSGCSAQTPEHRRRRAQGPAGVPGESSGPAVRWRAAAADRAASTIGRARRGRQDRGRGHSPMIGRLMAHGRFWLCAPAAKHTTPTASALAPCRDTRNTKGQAPACRRKQSPALIRKRCSRLNRRNR